MQFIIIVIFPKKVCFKVKNNKHHKIFNIPFKASNIFVCFRIFFMLSHFISIIVKDKYIIVQTMGITNDGIHMLGLVNPLNQSMPIFTKIDPSIATIKIDPIVIIIFKFLFSILLPYANRRLFIRNIEFD